MPGLCRELQLRADLGRGAALITVIRGTSLHVSLLARGPQDSCAAGCPVLTSSSGVGFSQLFPQNKSHRACNKPPTAGEDMAPKSKPCSAPAGEPRQFWSTCTLNRLKRTCRARRDFPWRQITSLEETRQATSTCFAESRATASPEHHKHAHKPWNKHQFPSWREHRRFSSAQRQVSRSQERFKRPLCMVFFQSLLLCQAL